MWTLPPTAPPVPPQVSLVVTEEHWGDYLPLTILGSVSKVQMHLKSVFANCSAPCYIPSFKGLPELQSGDREEKDDFDWRNCVKKEAAPTLISSVALHHLAFKAGKGTGEGGEKRTAEERQTDREQQKYWFPSPCLFRWLAWDGLIPGAASHTICLLSHISAPSLRRFKMVVFSSQLMPSERIIWGFSVFDILTTLLLSSRGVPQIFILKRKKKKKNTPQTLPNLFPPQPSLLKLLTSLSPGNSWDAVLFVYVLLSGSVTLAASKERGKDIWGNNS